MVVKRVDKAGYKPSKGTLRQFYLYNSHFRLHKLAVNTSEALMTADWKKQKSSSSTEKVSELRTESLEYRSRGTLVTL